MRDPLLQQHCWVRAVQLEHNPSAWANLGMLYLRWGLDIQVGQEGQGHSRGCPNVFVGIEHPDRPHEGFLSTWECFTFAGD